jgi:hypothetical protein
LRVWVTSLYEETTSTYGRTIAVLSGAAALIVLIACVNIAGLLLARGATRHPELAIRKSIPAQPPMGVRQASPAEASCPGTSKRSAYRCARGGFRPTPTTTAAFRSPCSASPPRARFSQINQRWDNSSSSGRGPGRLSQWSETRATRVFCRRSRNGLIYISRTSSKSRLSLEPA